MIRIGRGSKSEEPNEETNIPERRPNLTPVQQFRSGNPAPSGQALTESETMARDIKEGRLSGFVGSGTVLTGETKFQSMLRVDGHLTGSVASDDGTLIVGSTGTVDADIKVAVAIVNGIVNGDIVASEKLELGRTAKVAGNVQAPRLTIEDGAVFEGNCSMLKAQESLEQRKAEATAQTVEPEEISPYETSAVTSVNRSSSSDVDEIDEISEELSDEDEDEDETAEAATI
jgi:cytoskeletal protein CcmA (bactofilin family)